MANHFPKLIDFSQHPKQSDNWNIWRNEKGFCDDGIEDNFDKMINNVSKDDPRLWHRPIHNNQAENYVPPDEKWEIEQLKKMQEDRLVQPKVNFIKKPPPSKKENIENVAPKRNQSNVPNFDDDMDDLSSYGVIWDHNNKANNKSKKVMQDLQKVERNLIQEQIEEDDDKFFLYERSNFEKEKKKKNKKKKGSKNIRGRGANKRNDSKDSKDHRKVRDSSKSRDSSNPKDPRKVRDSSNPKEPNSSKSSSRSPSQNFSNPFINQNVDQSYSQLQPILESPLHENREEIEFNHNTFNKDVEMKNLTQTNKSNQPEPVPVPDFKEKPLLNFFKLRDKPAPDLTKIQSLKVLDVQFTVVDHVRVNIPEAIFVDVNNPNKVLVMNILEEHYEKVKWLIQENKTAKVLVDVVPNVHSSSLVPQDPYFFLYKILED